MDGIQLFSFTAAIEEFTEQPEIEAATAKHTLTNLSLNCEQHVHRRKINKDWKKVLLAVATVSSEEIIRQSKQSFIPLHADIELVKRKDGSVKRRRKRRKISTLL